MANQKGRKDLIGKRPKGDEAFRFWLRVAKSDGCWTWRAALNAYGYGAFWTADKKVVGAHRFSYQLHYGPIPEGMWVLHRCDNPPCVRPDHLFLGSPADNIHDMDSKGRGRRPGPRERCPQGHPYDESNTVQRKDGAKSCWLCRKEWRKTTRDRQLAEAIVVRCPRCASEPGHPCVGRFGVMASAHRERLQAARAHHGGA
ncbi:HNH endonuclease signature motif containing protein [Streptomyces malaysiensis]|uniref:HNH endonuclease signature motif containing protein n=1 Tax=Streptomyces malaysiensis TaxID=92644 RepID=UPI003689761F